MGGLEGRSGDDLLHDGHVAVVDVGVGDDVDQLARLQAGDLGKHVDQHRVLHHVPAVGGEHVLASAGVKTALSVLPVTLKVME